MLATWGIATIPSWQNEHVRRRLPGLWLEFVVLVALVSIAVTMILVTWQVSSIEQLNFSLPGKPYREELI